MSLSQTSTAPFDTIAAGRTREFGPQRFGVLALSLTLAAVAADQFLAPVLYSSSPLWALAVCQALVWRRGRDDREPQINSPAFAFSPSRLVLFFVLHALIVFAGMRLAPLLDPAAGTVSASGWAIAFLKLLVLAPTLVLVAGRHWRCFPGAYPAELVAGAVVLFTFFPARIFQAIWPVYGQLLGRLCFAFTKIAVPSASYAAALTPTLRGPALDLTILPACSGLSGVELFDCLFLFMVILDWNRLRKGPTAIAYFGGLLAMVAGNALRLISLFVLGNHGFADLVAKFHLSAGWLFFALVFVSYLACTYRWLLIGRTAASR